MKLFFIQEHSERNVFHGGICNVDAEKIFIRKGFIPVLFPFHYDFSLRAKLARICYLFKMFFTLPGNSAVIFQFPMYAGMNRLLIYLLTFRKSIRVICLIADIDGLRDGDEQLLQKEINAFRRYKYFIIHNDKMKQWLISKIKPVGISCFNFFDFLTPPVNIQRFKSFEIAFAGNLAKSSFLNMLGKVSKRGPALIFNIYGENPSDLMLLQTNVYYKGVFEPYSMPALLEGSFGLVWDGNTPEQLGGSFGKYQQVNTPHKPSLYILSGMPLIVNASSAVASLVKEHNIGLCINSLYELEMVIENLTEASYQQMIINTRDLAYSISRGDMLSNAIDALLTV